MKVPMYMRSAGQVNEIEVSDAVFGVEGPDSLVHSAVLRSLANGRQGSASTKTRGEVRGGGRKPWRQKGTGRARHGSIRSPIWRGGGVTFGPQPRDFSQAMNRRTRRLALLLALSAKVRDGGLMVIDELGLTEPKTRLVLEMLRQSGGAGGAVSSSLIVTAGREPNVLLSVRNLQGVRAIEARNINVYDVVKHQRVLLTKDALLALEGALAR